jgi:hypothetical protein
MSPLTCTDVEELAAELALGTLPGDQRSAVLGHLDGCPDCRRLVTKLSDTADALLLMAPEIDPPSGFAQRVIQSMVPRRRRWRPVALAAAAALVLGLAIGYVPGHVRSGSVAMVQVASFSHAGGEALAGQVYARVDNPSWVFMTIHDASSGDSYDCELVLKDGRVLPIGSFKTHNGVGSWGRGVDVSLNQIRLVRLRDASGNLAATASLTVG